MEQFIFQKDYVTELKNAVMKKEAISAYEQHGFTYNQDAAYSINLNRDDSLLESMMKYATPEHDYDAAITIYEAFPNLNREQACYEPFWVYLSHVDLYPYMIKRFCNGKKPNLADIKNHWWHPSLMRRGLSNLWWSVQQTIDEKNETDKYHYTKYCFQRIDFRQRRLGSSALFRHKEAVIGILKYLEKNVIEYFEGRANFIMMYFNKQATLKQLASCDRDYFYNELCGISEEINKVRDRTDASDILNEADDDSWE